MQGAPVVEIRGLTHSLGSTRVLDSINLRIDAASPSGMAPCVCMIGPNGAGKTTLLNLLTGLLKASPTATVNVLGETVHGFGAEQLAARGVCRSFQGAADVIPQLTVLANLSLVPRLTSVPWWRRLVFWPSWRRIEGAVRDEIRAMLVEFGCEELLPQLKRPAGSLSFGWKRVVSALRIHLAKPRVVLLDEPFAGLDPSKVRLVQGLIQAWQRDGRTVLFIEHIRSAAMRGLIESTADRLVMLDRGRVLLDGPPRLVLEDPRFVRAYTGANNTAPLRASPRTRSGSRASNRQDVLQFRSISARYNSMPVLQGIHATVRQGEHVLILGPNGAGKSTLLGAVHRLGERVDGEICFDRTKLLNKLPAFKVARLGVAFVPQRERIFCDIPVARNLAIAASTLSRADRRARIQESLELFPALQSRLKQLAGALSGGEQTQLAIALALIQRPAVLLADEISVGLDDQTSRHVMDALRKRVEEGLALVIAEQVYQVALEHCHWVLALRAGRVFWQGPPQDFHEDVQTRLFAGMELADQSR